MGRILIKLQMILFFLYMNKLKGFTFIEIIIVIGVISICLPVVFSIFFINLRNQTKIYNLLKVKQNGDYALNIIENTLRDKTVKIIISDTDLTEICTNTPDLNGSDIYFIDRQDKLESLSLQNNAIILKNINDNTTTSLTDSTVQITQLTFSCAASNTFLPPLISVSFTVSKQGLSSEEISTLSYQTKVRLRNK